MKFIQRIFFILALALLSQGIDAQPMPPAGENGGIGNTTNQPASAGGGAPIGDGLAFFAALAGGYVIRKGYLTRKENAGPKEIPVS